MALGPGRQEGLERRGLTCPVGRGLGLNLSSTHPHGRLWDPLQPHLRPGDCHASFPSWGRTGLHLGGLRSTPPPLPGGGGAGWAHGVGGAFGPPINLGHSPQGAFPPAHSGTKGRDSGTQLSLLREHFPSTSHYVETQPSTSLDRTGRPRPPAPGSPCHPGQRHWGPAPLIVTVSP